MIIILCIGWAASAFTSALFIMLVWDRLFIMKFDLEETALEVIGGIGSFCAFISLSNAILKTFI